MEEFHAALYAPEEDPITTPEIDAAAFADEEQMDTIDSLEQEETKPFPKTTLKTVAAEKSAEEKEVTEELSPKPVWKRNALGFFVSLSVLLLLVGTFIVLPPILSSPGSNPSAEEPAMVQGQCGDDVYWELNLDTGEMVLSGHGEMYGYDHVEGITTTPWEEYRNQITSLTVGDSVTVIGNWAFSYCPNLTDVHLGAAVIRLDVGAFECSGVANIHLVDSLEEISDGAFFGTMLEEVTLPSNLRRLGGNAFRDCRRLRSLTVTGEQTILCFDTYGGNFFYGTAEDFEIRGYTCSAFQEYARIFDIPFVAVEKRYWEAHGICGDDLRWYLDLDSGFLKIDGTGEMYDYNGTWQEQHELNPDLTYAPWAVFQEQIYVLSIGDGVSRIGQNAFSRCSIYDVHLGTGLSSIGPNAFLETPVDEMVFPNNVEEIGHNAFNWCSNLYYVELPDDLERLESAVFNQCLNLESIYIGRNTKLMDVEHTPFTQEGEEGLPPNMTIYGMQNSDAERFAGDCSIPFVIGYRGLSADFEGPCGDDVWWFADEDRGTLVIYGTGDTWEYKNDPDLMMQPFADDPNIRHAIILPGVEKLTHGLFEGMEQLQSVDFGTATYIGPGTLLGTSVEDVVIPETVTTIWAHSLSSPALTSATISGSCQISSCALFGTENLREVWFGPDVVITDNPDDGSNLFWEPNNNAYAPSDELIFYVVAGSDAERYAKQYGIHYEYYQ